MRNIMARSSGLFLAGLLAVSALGWDGALAQAPQSTGPIGGTSALREFLGRGLNEKLSLISHGHVDLTFNHISGSGAGADSFRVFDPPGPAPLALRFDPTLSSKLDGSTRDDGVSRKNKRFGKHLTPQALLRLRVGVKRDGWAVGAAGRFEFNADQEFDQELLDSAASLQKTDDLVSQAFIFFEKRNALQLTLGIQDPRPLFYSLVTSGEAGYLDFPEPVPAVRVVADLSKNIIVTLAREWERDSFVFAPAYRRRIGKGVFVVRGRVRRADKDPTPTFLGIERTVATQTLAGAVLYKSHRWRFAMNTNRRRGRRGAVGEIVDSGGALAYRFLKSFEMSVEAGRRKVRKSGLNTFNGGSGPPPFVITTLADANIWLDLQKGSTDWIGIGWDYDFNRHWEFTGGVKLERHDFADPALADRKRTTLTTALRYKF